MVGPARAASPLAAGCVMAVPGLGGQRLFEPSVCWRGVVLSLQTFFVKLTRMREVQKGPFRCPTGDLKGHCCCILPFSLSINILDQYCILYQYCVHQTSLHTSKNQGNDDEHMQAEALHWPSCVAIAARHLRAMSSHHILPRSAVKQLSS